MPSWKRSKSCRESKRKSVCVTQCSRSSIELKFYQSSSASKAVRSPSKRGVSKRWKAEMLQKCLGCLCYDIYLVSVWPEAQILLPTTKCVLVCCQTRSGTLFTAGKLLLIFHCFKAGLWSCKAASCRKGSLLRRKQSETFFAMLNTDSLMQDGVDVGYGGRR